jgi:tetratricopeptide (TPR) repeat protein
VANIQDRRDDIADLVAAGAVDAAAQCALLAVDAAARSPEARLSAMHLASLGVRYAAEGNSSAAREAFDLALDTASGESGNDDLRPRLYRNVAAALDTAGHHASAARCLEAAVEHGADGPAVWQALGRARLKAGDAPGALEALNHSQRLNPTAASTADRVLAELEVQSSPEAARRALARLEASRPEQASVRWDFALARAHQMAGDAAKAKATFLRVLEHADGELGAQEMAQARGNI